MSPKEKMVFHRFDSFLNRLNTMVEFFNTAVQVSYCHIVLHCLEVLLINHFTFREEIKYIPSSVFEA